jgi:hypothetical protein
MLKRPKGDGRCIHCRVHMAKRTKDHVFPDSWYPTSTPSKIQRWTVPSCERCNHDFGEMEKELFVRLALCVDPRKIGATGLSTRAVRSFGVDVAGISAEERRHREALRDRIRGGIKPYSSAAQPHILPGLDSHPGFPVDQLHQIEIPAELLYAVAKKIVRGCEYWLANGRIIEPPYEIEVFFPREMPQDVHRALGAPGTDYLGPGCRIRRAGAVDDPGVAMYEILIWESLSISFVILPPEAPETPNSCRHPMPSLSLLWPMQR